MGKRTWEPDEDPAVEGEQSPSTAILLDQDEPATIKASLATSDKERQLREEMVGYQREFYDIQGEDSGSAQTRRAELRRLMRLTQKSLDAMEPIVEVQVPRSPTGQFYNIGTHTFAPGLHRVRKGVAQMLLWAIQSQQQAEMAMMKQNGRTIDVTSLGDRARNLDIMADN